jgi:hypothetical protein
MKNIRTIIKNPKPVLNKVNVSKIIISLACLIAASCQPTLIAEFEDKPVVTCFLDAGASPWLTVSKVTAFRDDAIYSDEDVNALSITIADETDNQTCLLQSVGNGRYENPQLIVQSGHTYRLDFIYNRKPVSATATVPAAPQDVEFSATAMGVMPPINQGDPFPDLDDLLNMTRQIEITWNNDDRNFYIVEGFTESTEIIEGMMLSSNQQSGDASKSFKLEYTQGDYATVSSMQFRYIGDYEVSLIRIQPEYVLMSQGTATNTSTDIADVKGNIDGGYGLFTGINRITRIINVHYWEKEGDE